MFMWFADVRYIQDDRGQIVMSEKPQLSFEYAAIRYYAAEKVYETPQGETLPLTTQQQEELDGYILSKRQEVGVLKPAIDSQGRYIGITRDDNPNVFSTVSMRPPNDDDWIWNFDNESWAPAYHYDSNGYLTVERAGNSAGFTKKPYPHHKHPIKFKYDTTADDWVIDNSRPELQSMIRNKIIFDSLLEYLRVNLILNADPQDAQIDYQYLQEIVGRVTGMQSWRTANITDANVCTTLNTVDRDFLQLMQTVSDSNKTILEIHNTGLEFQQSIAGVIRDNLYKGNAETVEEIAINDFINNI